MTKAIEKFQQKLLNGIIHLSSVDCWRQRTEDARSTYSTVIDLDRVTSHDPVCTMKAPFLLLLSSVPSCMGFAPRQALQVTATTPSSIPSSHLQLAPIDVTDVVSTSSHVASIHAIQQVVSSSSMVISETEAWVQPLSAVLGPFLNFFSFGESFDSN